MGGGGGAKNFAWLYLSRLLEFSSFLRISFVYAEFCRPAKIGPLKTTIHSHVISFLKALDGI